jgi:glycerol-3-phosphate dehydrogenase
MIGGKWTTFRAFASHTAEEIGKHLKVPVKASSENEVIGGGKGFPLPGEREKWISQRLQPGLPAGRLGQLLERYGTVADRMLPYVTRADDRPLKSNPLYTTGEMLYLIENEMVEHLDDLVLRRTAMGLRGELSREMLIELAELMAGAKPGKAANPTAELARTLAILKKKHAVNL